MSIRNLRKKLFPTARSKYVAYSLKKINFDKGCKVLVIGSGYDPYREIFPFPEMYICLDIIPTKDKTDIVADAHFLPFINGHFDVVLASEVFEHLRNPSKLIDESYRVLKKNGQLIITVPFMFHQHADLYDYWRPTRSALQMLCEKYSDISVSNQGNRFHVIFDLLTTAFHPLPIFYPLRILNHLLVLPSQYSTPIFKNSTAPTGFVAQAKK